jgi:hypothetical protein
MILHKQESQLTMYGLFLVTLMLLVSSLLCRVVLQSLKKLRARSLTASGSGTACGLCFFKKIKHLNFSRSHEINSKSQSSTTCHWKCIVDDDVVAVADVSGVAPLHL